MRNQSIDLYTNPTMQAPEDRKHRGKPRARAGFIHRFAAASDSPRRAASTAAWRSAARSQVPPDAPRVARPDAAHGQAGGGEQQRDFIHARGKGVVFEIAGRQVQPLAARPRKKPLKAVAKRPRESRGSDTPPTFSLERKHKGNQVHTQNSIPVEAAASKYLIRSRMFHPTRTISINTTANEVKMMSKRHQHLQPDRCCPAAVPCSRSVGQGDRGHQRRHQRTGRSAPAASTPAAADSRSAR